MTLTNYAKGRAREYGAMKRLRKMGALTVMRAYASKGIFDLIAIFPSQVLLIQVKKDYINPKERKVIEEYWSKISADNIRVQVWFYIKGRLKIHDLATEMQNVKLVV